VILYKLIRPLLFLLPPEAAHNLTLQLLQIAGNPSISLLLQWMYSAPDKPIEVFGKLFRNPVGLAAGYDKDGVAVRGLSALGFGHIEIGTVTLRPQSGNPKPRVFRLPKDQAVINRMGFPGLGADFVEGQLIKMVLGNFADLKHYFPNGRAPIIGVNLGKNKDTPLEEAAGDYLKLISRLINYTDYITINISSPNTIGLRRLQGRAMLEGLLGEIAKERETMAIKGGSHAPFLVKLAPDLTDEELEDAVGVILDKNMDGIIATNTTLAREALRSRNREEAGGLSGSPLRVQSEAMLEKIVRQVDGRVPIVSVGGILNPDDAKRRLGMGATLIQIYTGLVYRGPGLVKEIINSL